MTTATITSKGQITIPKDVRQRLELETGDRVEFVEVDKGVFHLVPMTRDIRSIKGLVKKPKHPVTVADMKRAVEETSVSK